MLPALEQIHAHRALSPLDLPINHERHPSKQSQIQGSSQALLCRHHQHHHEPKQRLRRERPQTSRRSPLGLDIRPTAGQEDHDGRHDPLHSLAHRRVHRARPRLQPPIPVHQRQHDLARPLLPERRQHQVSDRRRALLAPIRRLPISAAQLFGQLRRRRVSRPRQKVNIQVALRLARLLRGRVQRRLRRPLPHRLDHDLPAQASAAQKEANALFPASRRRRRAARRGVVELELELELLLVAVFLADFGANASVQHERVVVEMRSAQAAAGVGRGQLCKFVRHDAQLLRLQ